MSESVSPTKIYSDGTYPVVQFQFPLPNCYIAEIFLIVKLNTIIIMPINSTWARFLLVLCSKMWRNSFVSYSIWNTGVDFTFVVPLGP